MGVDRDEDIAVTYFRKYLRIDTEQPNPDYQKCKEFLFEYGKELGLECWSEDCVSGKPMVGMTILGQNPSLPSLLLYSHTDVVPTFKDQWTHDPYEAFKDQDGNIYARGAQDMKCVGVQYLEAIRRLQNLGKKNFLRTIHILFGPDEEIGAAEGIQKFLKTQRFKDLNVGYSLDEGLASEDDTYKIYYGERNTWWLIVKCPGSPGHGSRFLDNNCGLKLQSILNSFLGYREEQRQRLIKENLPLGSVTSVNLTKVEGGVQINVVPDEFRAWFDIRVIPTENFEAFEETIKEWCKKAGPDVTYEFILQNKLNVLTPTTKEEPFWRAFSSVLEEENCKYVTEIFIGATDSRYLREIGIKALGFSPMINTPVLLHDHNEFLNEKVFLRGVEIYTKLIERMANVPKH